MPTADAPYASAEPSFQVPASFTSADDARAKILDQLGGSLGLHAEVRHLNQGLGHITELVLEDFEKVGETIGIVELRQVRADPWEAHRPNPSQDLVPG